MPMRITALAFAILVFLDLRHRLDDWIQGRFFMATDFEHVSIRDVRRVKPQPDENGPVHVVETIVHVKSTTPAGAQG